VRCSVIHCVAACCGVLWLVVVGLVCTYGSRSVVVLRVLQCVAVCCSKLQCDAV